MKKEKIYQYFEKKYDTYDTSLISKEIPDEMIEDGKWLKKLHRGVRRKVST